MQAAGGQTGVEVLGAVGHRLQQLQQMQPYHPHGIGAVGEGDVEPLPEVRPLAAVAVAEFAVAAEPVEQSHRGVAGIGDGVIAPGEDNRHLL